MAQRHSGHARAAADFYTEEPWVPEWLFAHEPFDGPVLDPACGIGTIPLAALKVGVNCWGSDLHDRGYGETGVDWLEDAGHFINTESHPEHTYFPEQSSTEIKKGGDFSLVFEKPGQYNYHCSAHVPQGMLGSIIVAN